MVTVVNRSYNADIDGLLYGYRWDDNTFTYAFPTSASSYGGYGQITGFEAFNSAQQAVVRRVLSDVASFANVTFTQVADASQAELRYAEVTTINYNDG